MLVSHNYTFGFFFQRLIVSTRHGPPNITNPLKLLWPDFLLMNIYIIIIIFVIIKNTVMSIKSNCSVISVLCTENLSMPRVSQLFDRRAKCTDFNLVRDQTTAEMPKASKGKGNGEGCSPPQPTRGSGERRKLPSGVREKRVLAYCRA